MSIMFIIKSLVILLCPFYTSSSVNYLLFENFEVTKTTFVEEQNIFQNVWKIRNSLNLKNKLLDKNDKKYQRQLKKIKHNQTLTFRKYLFDRRKEVKSEIIQDDSFSSMSVKSNIGMSHWVYRDIKHSFNHSFGFEKAYVNTTQTQLITSALKGLIMLQDTYGQNIKHFSRGKSNIKISKELGDRVVDTLQVEDLVAMAGISFNELHWYDASIRYLKEAIDVFSSTAKKSYRSIVFENILDDCLNAMKRLYPSYHNKMLDKMGNAIGIDYKLFPLSINEGSRSTLRESCSMFNAIAFHCIMPLMHLNN